jgi:hypothetical protein
MLSRICSQPCHPQRETLQCTVGLTASIYGNVASAAPAASRRLLPSPRCSTTRRKYEDSGSISLEESLSRGKDAGFPYRSWEPWIPFEGLSHIHAFYIKPLQEATDWQSWQLKIPQTSRLETSYTRFIRKNLRGLFNAAKERNCIQL